MTDIEECALLLDRAVKTAMKDMLPQEETNNAVPASIKFSSGAVKRMSPAFAKEFRRNGRVAHIIKSCTVSGIRYEIRYRRNGYNITVFDKDLAEAKRKFILSAISYSRQPT